MTLIDYIYYIDNDALLLIPCSATYSTNEPIVGLSPERRNDGASLLKRRTQRSVLVSNLHVSTGEVQNRLDNE